MLSMHFGMKITVVISCLFGKKPTCIYVGVVMLHVSFTCTILVSDKVGFCSVLIQREYIYLALYFQISHHFCCLHAFGWNFRGKSSGVLGERHYFVCMRLV